MHPKKLVDKGPPDHLKNCDGLRATQQRNLAFRLPAFSPQITSTKLVRKPWSLSIPKYTSILSKSLSRTELVRQLCVSLDDTGLLSCFHNAPVTESTKFPLLLPPKDPFTELVIRDTHVHQLQAGVNSTLTSLHLGYWIPAGCQHKKKVINHCVTCKKISGSPYILDPPPLT